MQHPPIRDDNLRLIYSKGHTEWLDREIKKRLVIAGMLSFFLLLAGSWIYMENVHFQNDTGSYAQPEIINPPVFIISIIAAIILPLFIGKTLFDVRKFRRWRVEHVAFLESYNRKTD